MQLWEVLIYSFWQYINPLSFKNLIRPLFYKTLKICYVWDFCVTYGTFQCKVNGQTKNVINWVYFKFYYIKWFNWLLVMKTQWGWTVLPWILFFFTALSENQQTYTKCYMWDFSVGKLYKMYVCKMPFFVPSSQRFEEKWICVTFIHGALPFYPYLKH